MNTKPRWANILCNLQMEPYLLIVTDGEWTSEIPVKNSRLGTVKLAAKNVYGVPPRRMVVTQILDPIPFNEEDNSTRKTIK
jgi:hypothetical protein